MLNKVVKIQGAVLDEEAKAVALTLERDDAAELNLELTSSLLAELVGLACMASELVNSEAEPSELDGSVPTVVGVGVSTTVDASEMLVRFEDREGFFHAFQMDERRGAKLRLQIQRAIIELRKGNGGD